LPKKALCNPGEREKNQEVKAPHENFAKNVNERAIIVKSIEFQLYILHKLL
jgi:hypothetical protein